MTGESQQVPETAPDPSVFTTEAVTRAVAAERDFVKGQLDVLKERLRGIDKATEVLKETVNRTPTDIEKEVTHLRELADVKFESVAKQFAERDTRSEREAKDNQIRVDAAFAAADKAAEERNKSNTLAISKSEAATTETINKLGELVKTATDALADKIEDVKARLNSLELRVAAMEANRAGSRERTTDQRQSIASISALVGIAVGVVGLLGILGAAGVLK